jgi:hypothetical protein
MKIETVAEFLARGGVITKVSTTYVPSKVESVKSTSTGGPATIITMEEADLYHGEYKPKKAKKKVVPATIDLSALPPELRKKYVDEVIYGQKNNTNEEETSSRGGDNKENKSSSSKEG